MRAIEARTLALALNIVSATAITDGPAGTVGEYGGRWIGGNEIRLLDPATPAIHRIDGETLSSRVQPLTGADAPLDPYGLALPGDGTIWALADKGRFVVRFSERTGALVEKRSLPEPCQGIATFWNNVGFLAVRLRPGERMLLRAENGAFRPFSPLVSRPAAGLPGQLIANLVRCGSGTSREVPCWFAAGDPDVFLIARSGETRSIRVPSFASPSPARGASREPGVAFTYPLRDAFLLDGDALWVLSNQDGDRIPLEEGARRGRHISLVRRGRPERTLSLPSEARAILAATDRAIVLLFVDGSIRRVAS